MRFIADLQIHSKYSRAVSPSMVLEELDRWADDKGILVMGTGDFTHPAWHQELKEKLEPAEPGLFRLRADLKRNTIKGRLAETRFLLSAEISNIYSRGGRTRRVHNLIFAPNLRAVERIIGSLSLIGSLHSDGRPILGLDSEELTKIVLNADERCAVIPAHAWTPWFSVFGSMSGFDSLQECYGEYAKHIFAIETGLSSDPQMNWRLSQLDGIAIVSNSDSHSLEKIGREANVFDTELSYDGIIAAIKSHDPRRFLHTIEFFPEEGKYHYDGHRVCGVSLAPAETKKHNNLCPECGRRLTIGVMNRIEMLADRPEQYHDPKRIPFKSIIPLHELLAEALMVGRGAKAVRQEYETLIQGCGSEFAILLEAPIDQIREVGGALIAEAVQRMREGRVSITPGFDGEFGKVHIFDDHDRTALAARGSLF